MSASVTVQGMAFRIADAAARVTVCSYSAPAKRGWHDTRVAGKEDQRHLDQAVRYLEMRDLLRRSKATPGLVRLVD